MGEEKVTALKARDALMPGSALESKESYKDEAYWRWEAMIKGGAVSSSETPVTCIAKAAYGESFGWAPLVAISRVYLVDGKPCLAAEAMVGLVRERLPKAQIEKVRHTTLVCTVQGRRDPEDAWHVCEFTFDDAKAANLQNKTNWKRYPKPMLWARAISMLTRELFSDVTLGAHTPEEVEGKFTVTQEQRSHRGSSKQVEAPSLRAEDEDQRPKEEPEDAVFVERCELCGGEDGKHTDQMCPENGAGDRYTEGPSDEVET